MRILGVAAVTAAFIFLIGASFNPATAAPETQELLAIVKSLEARVVALEAENKRYKQRESRAQLAMPVESPRRAAATPAPRASDSFASLPVKAAPIRALDDGWTNVYWGASFGGEATRGATRSLERNAVISPNNPPPFNNSGNVQTTQGGPTTGYGVTADLLLGFNTRLSSNIVAGLQLEGSISNLDFTSTGTRSWQYFDANGPTGQTALGDFRPIVRLRWMASALARAGVLVNPDTLLYGIGGWTVAGFDYQNLTHNTFYEDSERFVANGPSVGAGFERKLDPNWSVRAEYRYTYFLPVNVHSDSAFSTFSTPFASTQTNSISARFENSMHTARIGIAYAMPVGR